MDRVAAPATVRDSRLSGSRRFPDWRRPEIFGHGRSVRTRIGTRKSQFIETIWRFFFGNFTTQNVDVATRAQALWRVSATPREREKKRFLTRDEEASTALSASSEKSQEKVREGEREGTEIVREGGRERDRESEREREREKRKRPR